MKIWAKKISIFIFILAIPLLGVFLGSGRKMENPKETHIDKIK